MMTFLQHVRARCAWIALALILPLGTKAALYSPTEGGLDLTYGSSGTSSVSLGASDVPYGSFMQSDGKMLVVGGARPGATEDFGVARFNSDGSLDAGFGTNGVFTLDVTAGRVDRATCVGVQTQGANAGKIIVGGYTRSVAASNDFVLLRLTASGALDPTFGTSGKLQVDFFGFSDSGYCLKVLSDDRIVLVGRTATAAGDLDFGLIRTTAEGVLDVSFGAGGRTSFNVGNSEDTPNGMALDASGNIIVAGISASAGQNYKYTLLRFTASGAIDGTFGSGGVVAGNFGGSTNDNFLAVAVQADGKIVASGYSSGTNTAAIARFTAAGALDATFNTTGYNLVDIGGNSDQFSALLIQPNGRIVAGGNWVNGTATDSLLVRFTTSGALDTSFATSGKFTGSLAASNDRIVGLGSQSSGRIVAAFQSAVSNGLEDFGVGRFEILAPSVSSIVRQSPSTASTTATSLTWRVTFSEAVSGVDTADFSLTATGSAGASVASVSASSGSTIDVTASSITGTGTLRLDVASAATVVNGVGNNLPATGYTAGETYSVSPGVVAPTIAAVSPAGGSTAGGTSVTISGTGFTDATAVMFGGILAPSYMVTSATTIIATSPAASAGSVYVTVTTPAGASATGAASQFGYFSAPSVASPTSTGVTAITATLGGNVSADGGSAITARGVVVAKTSTNSDPQLVGTGVTNLTTSGTTGVFTIAAAGLQPATSYSYKAYATNLAGTTYTSVGTFTTAVETQTASTGSGSPSAIGNAQPSLGLTWVIAKTGVFPSRDGGPMTDRFIGEIRAIAYDASAMASNSGWVPCNGQLLSIASNTALFSLLGTQFGGNGTTNFALPDLRGRVPIGIGGGPGLSERVIGETGGQETNTLSVATLPAHSHSYTGGVTGPAGGGGWMDNAQPWLALNLCVVGDSYDITTGWIRIFAFNFAPGGHYACDGSTLPISGHEDLFSKLGTTYGGNGATTFAVPDLRGRTPIGFGQGPGLSSRAVGELGGSESILLTTTQIPAHTHAYSGGATGSTGGNQPHDTMQPYLAVRAMISTAGLFGSMDDTPGLGEMRLMASPGSAPGAESGWYPCDGSLQPIAENEACYALLGTAFGGDGVSTFAMPDLRGRTLVGQGTGPGLAPRFLAEQWGVENVTITSGQLPAHVHVLASAPVITNATLVASGTYGSALSTYTITASGSPTSFSASGLPSGVSVNSTNGQITGTPTATGTFTVTLGATNGVGTGNATLVLTIAKAGQTISWTAPANKTYGDAAFSVSATATSGLPVSYSVVSGPATISGNTVTITGAGAVTLRADQAGSANYTAASGVNAGFTVGKATAVVTLGGLDATYDAAAHAATVVTSPAALAVTLTYDGGGTAPTNAGSYAVVGTISDANYQGSASGTLTIAKAPLTVTAASAARVYGAANPAFSAAITGFVNGQTIATAGVSGSPALSTTALAMSGVGTYAITTGPGTLSAANYAFTSLVNGTLTITKAVLTVSADNKSRGFAAANPEFTASVAGFVNGDTLAATTGAPVLATTATTASAQGTYPITVTPGTLAAANYDFALVDGVLTVTKAVLTVVPDNQTRSYGAENPTLTYSITGFLNGDTSAVVTGMPALATSATAASPVSTYAITADVSGLSATNYLFTADSGTLTVGKATLTVTADDKTRTYGAANPAFTAAISGFVNSDTLGAVTGTPALTTAATAATGVGTAAITAAEGDLAATNYSFTFVPGTLTITPAPLTVAADDKSKVYGGALPAFTATLTGFVNGENSSSAGVTGTAAIATAATAGSSVATYALVPTAGTLAAANYAFTTFNNGTLTITKASLTVSADAKTRVYGASNPALTATITGFVNGDTLAAVTGSAALSTAATANTGVGGIAITAAAGDLAAANYTFSFVPGTLTITKAPLAVTADNQAKVYGAALPALTASLTGFVNGETAVTAGITGTAATSTSATASSGVNTYAIVAGPGTLAAANYAFTNFVDGTLTVSKATLTVTADDLSRGYGAANPTFTSAVTGLVNGDTLAATSGAPLLTTPATTTSAQGTYPITVALGTLAAANYDFALVDGTLTVTKAVLTVTADDKSRTYGAANPALTYTVAGYLNGDTAAVITGLPGLATAATATSNVGTFAITTDVSGLSASNYSIAAVNGTLTVSPATLAVTADNASRAYNTVNPAFTATITGFVNGDTVAAAVNGAPELATAALSTSGVGSYPIVPTRGTLTSANYAFTFVDGALSVTPATVLLQLTGLTHVYDGLPHSAAVSTSPPGLATLVIYAGGSSAPVNAGSYAVTASVTDSNFVGSTSGTLVIGRATQSLSFTLSGSSLTVGAPITLNASARSGLPVTFSVVSGNASLSGTTLVVNDTNVVTVRATQAGNANYLAVSADQVIAGTAKQSQTISFAALADRLASDAPFPLVANASSGLPVAFAVVGGPAVLDGSMLRLSGTAGTVTIRASQPGNGTFAAAADVIRAFTVSDRGNNVYFGEVANSSEQKVGDIAASIPANSNAGTLMVVASQLGVHAVLEFKLEADGSFVSTVVVPQATAIPVEDGAPARAAAATTLTVHGRLAGGILSGRIDELNLNFSTSVLPRTGPTAAIAGYYESNTLNTSTGSTASIVGTQGQMLIVATTPTIVTGATGAISPTGTFNVPVPGATITGAVDAPTTTVNGAIIAPGADPVPFSGLLATTTRTDRLINLSSRVRVGPTAGRTLITGFVIGGNSAKRVLLRAVGPALTGFGVSGALGNPRLEVYDSTGARLLENEDWTGAETAAAFNQVGAFGLAAGSRDAALLATLAPGAYTMHVHDGGETGVALAEIYDASANAQAEYQRLINISTRGTVEAGDGVLIGGFVVTGNAPKRVLVRGIGPALAGFGVTGALADPRLRIFKGSEVVGENDNWSANSSETAILSGAMRDTGAFALPAGSRDSAVTLALAPGAYTAQVSSADGSTGVALVEIYEIPE